MKKKDPNARKTHREVIDEEIEKRLARLDELLGNGQVARDHAEKRQGEIPKMVARDHAVDPKSEVCLVCGDAVDYVEPDTDPAFRPVDQPARTRPLTRPPDA